MKGGASLSYLKFLFVPFIIAPVAFFIGYRLRPVVPKRKRLAVGFILSITVLTLVLGIDLFFPVFKVSQTGIGTAIAIGFPLGLAGPPYKEK